MRMLTRMYNTKVGKLLWKMVSMLFKFKSVRHVAQCGISSYYCDEIDSLNFPLIKLEEPKNSNCNNVLIIFPFYDKCASTYYMNDICLRLKAKGYRLTGLLYGESSEFNDSEIFDYKYNVSVLNRFLSNENIHYNESYNVDEWIGDELIQFVTALVKMKQFDLCIINYVFLSKVLEYLPNEIDKWIITHDKFSNRNIRMKDAGINSECWYFSTTVEEEKRGIERANKIISIQPKESKYFRELSNIIDVITVPYIPQKNYLNKERESKKMLIVGYLGSNNPPNISAVHGLISKIKGNKCIKLVIAGTVCRHLKLKSSNGLIVLGEIEDVKPFYEKIDIFINPDLFYSGLKIKTIEAMSYGKAVVCTKASADGLNSNSIYHNATDLKDCIKLLQMLSEDDSEYEKCKVESKQCFESLSNKYNVDKLLDKMLI